jgi:hypothetical protein
MSFSIIVVCKEAIVVNLQCSKITIFLCVCVCACVVYFNWFFLFIFAMAAALMHLIFSYGVQRFMKSCFFSAVCMLCEYYFTNYYIRMAPKFK